MHHCGGTPQFHEGSPLIRALEKANKEGFEINDRLVYAGTENDATLEASLFENLEIRRPDVFLGVDCTNLNELTGRVMEEFDAYLTATPTDAVIVVDDLASTMAAAIVTKKHGIALAHLVAGTRSFDISMPKEINRLIIDGLSDYLFTAGISSNSIASREALNCHRFTKWATSLWTRCASTTTGCRPAIMDALNLKEGKYIVFTLNRKALIADTKNLTDMVKAMTKAAGDTPIIAALRDGAKEALQSVATDAPTLHVTDTLPYLEFGYLTAHAAGIVTDSGNVAEEATFNIVPCITLNKYTEHIETVKQGSNVLVGEDPAKLAEAIKDMTAGRWKKCSLPDRWDGRTAERIVHILLSNIKPQSK